MIALPANTRIWIAAGVTDMRRGFTGLSALVQTALEQDPLSGHVFAFRGRRGDLINNTRMRYTQLFMRLWTHSSRVHGTLFSWLPRAQRCRI
jgi:transposase